MAERRKCGCSKGPGGVSSIIPDTSPTAKICINTDKAPLPVGPYSQAVKMDNTIYISGCLGLTMDTGTLIEGGAGPEAKLALKNMGTILEAAGSSYNNVLKTTVFISDMDDFSTINDTYKLFFYKDYPARSCVQVVKLPLDAKVEIEAIATIVQGGAPGAPPAPPAGGGEAVADAPPADVPPADAAPADAAPADEAPADAPADAPPEDAPPADAPPADAPPGDAPPGDAAPAEDAPAEGAPAEDAPAEGAPAEDAPAEGAPAEDAPAEGAPAEDAPAEGAPAEDAPAEGAPAEDAPPA